MALLGATDAAEACLFAATAVLLGTYPVASVELLQRVYSPAKGAGAAAGGGVDPAQAGGARVGSGAFHYGMVAYAATAVAAVCAQQAAHVATMLRDGDAAGLWPLFAVPAFWVAAGAAMPALATATWAVGRYAGPAEGDADAGAPGEGTDAKDGAAGLPNVVPAAVIALADAEVATKASVDDVDGYYAERWVTRKKLVLPVVGLFVTHMMFVVTHRTREATVSPLGNAAVVMCLVVMMGSLYSVSYSDMSRMQKQWNAGVLIFGLFASWPMQSGALCASTHTPALFADPSDCANVRAGRLAQGGLSPFLMTMMTATTMSTRWQFTVLLALQSTLTFTTASVLRAHVYTPDARLEIALLAVMGCLTIAVNALVSDINGLANYIMRARLRAEQQATKIFIGYIFHEVRVPLSVISTGLALLAMDGGEKARARNPASGSSSFSSGSGMTSLDCPNSQQFASREHIDTIASMARSCTVVQRVLDDVLDVMKHEEQMLVLCSEAAHFGALIEREVSTQKGVFSAAGVKLSLVASENTRAFLNTHALVLDPFRIGQVINNLLSNAAKFTPEGGSVTVTYAARIVEGDAPAAGGGGAGERGADDAMQPTCMVEVDLSVADTGCGISIDDSSRLFQPYSQTRAGLRRNAKHSSGLGLYLCRIIVDLHGGKLDLESKVGEGSTFSIHLRVPACAMPTMPTAAVGEDMVAPAPIHPEGGAADGDDGEDGGAELAAVTAAMDTRPEGGGGTRRARALVVEDAPLNRKIFVRLLEKLGVVCEEAADGLAAVEAFEAGGEYDVVFMDSQMPVMCGGDATSKIRALGVSIPIVGLTGNTLTDEREEFVKRGLSDFIAKPPSHRSIVSVLNKYGLLNRTLPASRNIGGALSGRESPPSTLTGGNS